MMGKISEDWAKYMIAKSGDITCILIVKSAKLWLVVSPLGDRIALSTHNFSPYLAEQQTRPGKTQFSILAHPCSVDGGILGTCRP